VNTGERYGSYEDFGTVAHLARALRTGFCHPLGNRPWPGVAPGGATAILVQSVGYDPANRALRRESSRRDGSHGNDPSGSGESAAAGDAHETRPAVGTPRMRHEHSPKHRWWSDDNADS
jgi:hypothetical protein